jgi:hypothetical protein
MLEEEERKKEKEEGGGAYHPINLEPLQNTFQG